MKMTALRAIRHLTLRQHLHRHIWRVARRHLLHIQRIPSLMVIAPPVSPPPRHQIQHIQPPRSQTHTLQLLLCVPAPCLSHRARSLSLRSRQLQSHQRSLNTTASQSFPLGHSYHTHLAYLGPVHRLGRPRSLHQICSPKYQQLLSAPLRVSHGERPLHLRQFNLLQSHRHHHISSADPRQPQILGLQRHLVLPSV